MPSTFHPEGLKGAADPESRHYSYKKIPNSSAMGCELGFLYCLVSLVLLWQFFGLLLSVIGGF